MKDVESGVYSAANLRTGIVSRFLSSLLVFLLTGTCVVAQSNPIVVENLLPGNPPSEWDIDGAGDTTHSGIRDGHQRQQGEHHSIQGQDQRDELPVGYLSPRLLRRLGREIRRHGIAIRFSSSNPAQPDYRLCDGTGGLRELGRVRFVARPRDGNVGSLHRQAGPNRHRGRESHSLCRPRRFQHIGHSFPNLGYHMAGL